MDPKSLRLWLKQKARKVTSTSTEWHEEMVRDMADRAVVSKNEVRRMAYEFLAVNFDPQMFKNRAA